MTETYWRIVQRIFEQEQRGRVRAGYGAQLVEQLARDLSARFGRGQNRRLPEAALSVRSPLKGL
jgi:hypothetical protein